MVFVYLGVEAFGVRESVCVNCADIQYFICLLKRMRWDNVLITISFEPTDARDVQRFHN